MGAFEGESMHVRVRAGMASAGESLVLVAPLTWADEPGAPVGLINRIASSSCDRRHQLTRFYAVNCLSSTPSPGKVSQATIVLLVRRVVPGVLGKQPSCSVIALQPRIDRVVWSRQRYVAHEFCHLACFPLCRGTTV